MAAVDVGARLVSVVDVLEEHVDAAPVEPAVFGLVDADAIVSIERLVRFGGAFRLDVDHLEAPPLFGAVAIQERVAFSQPMRRTSHSQ